MTKASAVALYKLFIPRLAQREQDKDEVKAEPVYMADDVPGWAKELREEVQNIQKMIYPESSSRHTEGSSQSESDDLESVQETMFTKSIAKNK